MQNYLKKRKAKDPDAPQLFLNANGSPLTRFGIRHITGKHATAAKRKCPSISNKAVSPHTIRHATAVHLLRSGNDINMVGYWLGHADINTTHIYVEIDMEMKRQMLQKAGAPAVQKPFPWQKPGVLQWLKGLARAPNYVQKNTTTSAEGRGSGAMEVLSFT